MLLTRLFWSAVGCACLAVLLFPRGAVGCPVGYAYGASYAAPVVAYPVVAYPAAALVVPAAPVVATPAVAPVAVAPVAVTTPVVAAVVTPGYGFGHAVAPIVVRQRAFVAVRSAVVVPRARAAVVVHVPAARVPVVRVRVR